MIEGEPSMYEIAIWMITVPLCIVIVPNIVVELDKLCSRLDELIERRKRRRELMIEYHKWYDKAVSCDNFGGAIDKGKAIARLIIIKNEIEMR